jgi:hypothetical protein
MKKIYPQILNPISACLFSFFFITSANAQSTVVPSKDCATAPEMILPDTLLPYCSALTEGMIFQGGFKLDSITGDNECFTKYYKGNAWYKFKIPQGKGIKGFLLDVSLNAGCSSCVDQPFYVDIYKGNSCNSLAYKGGDTLHYCVTADLRGFYKNLPAHYDSANENEIYYLNFITDSMAGNKIINPGIKWLGEPVSNNECSKSMMLTTPIIETCNRIIPVSTAAKDYPGNCNPGNNPPFNYIYNPVYFSFVPKVSAVSFTIKAVNCFSDYSNLYAFVYKNCEKIGSPESLYGCVTNHFNSSESIKLDLTDLPVGDTLILVVDPQQPAPGIDFQPKEAGTCGLQITSDGILLPTDLTSFTGNYNSTLKKVTLKWTSAKSTVTSFVVERSQNGINFSEAGQVISAENPIYTFDDLSYFPGKSYYRLKEIRRDRRYTYSNIVTINSGIQKQLRIYPNPVKDVLILETFIVKKQQRIFIITDMSGRILQQRTINTNAGKTILNFDVSHLQSGSYILVDQGEQKNAVRFQKD